MTIDQLKNEKLGMCVSGGLDSKTLTMRLKEAGCDVTCFTADLAQPDEPDISNVVKKMAPCGVKTVVVDVKNDMADICLQTVKALATYDGGYWNSTGIARAVTVRALLREMKKRGITVLCHGATGRGNDQMRFERYVNVFEPRMKVYAPWRDPSLLREFPGRTQMCAYLAKHGIVAFPGGKKKYSTDANLAGLSHEAEDLESIETAMTIVEPEMGVWPKDAPDKIEKVAVTFEKGRPVAINGKKMSPLEIMLAANKIGGRNGIGLSHALENRIIGTKSRGVYEAPGMELLGRCMRFLYEATLDRRSTTFFLHLSRFIAEQTYDGRFYDPATRAAFAAIDTFAVHATGEVAVGLYKGNVLFLSLKDLKSTLYHEADSSMEASSGLNPASSQGFAEIQSVEARSMAYAGLIKK